MKGEERLRRLMDDITPIISHYQQIALRRRCSKWPRQEWSKQERRHKQCRPLLIPRPPCYTFCLPNITPHHEKRCWGNWRASQARPRQGRSGGAERGQLVGLSLEPRLWQMLPPQHRALSSSERLLPSALHPSRCTPALFHRHCPSCERWLWLKRRTWDSQGEPESAPCGAASSPLAARKSHQRHSAEMQKVLAEPATLFRPEFRVEMR